MYLKQKNASSTSTVTNVSNGLFCAHCIIMKWILPTVLLAILNGKMITSSLQQTSHQQVKLQNLSTRLNYQFLPTSILMVKTLLNAHTAHHDKLSTQAQYVFICYWSKNIGQLLQILAPFIEHITKKLSKCAIPVLLHSTM